MSFDELYTTYLNFPVIKKRKKKTRGRDLIFPFLWG